MSDLLLLIARSVIKVDRIYGLSVLSGLSSQMLRFDTGGGLGSTFKKGHKDKRT